MNLHPLLLPLRGRRRSWASLSPLPFIVLLLALALIVGADMSSLRVFGFLAAPGLLALWALFGHSLLLQNRAQLAQLVPGHTRTLRRLLLVSTLLTCLGVVLVLRLAGLPMTALEVALIVSVFIAMFGWLHAMPFSNPWFNVGFSCTVYLAFMQLHRHWTWVSEALAGLGPLAWGLVALPLLSLGWAVSRGGPAHTARQQRRDSARAMQKRIQSGDFSLGAYSARSLPARLAAWEWTRLRRAGPMRRVAWLLLRPLTAPQMLMQSSIVMALLVLLLWVADRFSPGLWRMGHWEMGAVMLPLFGLMTWVMGWLSSRLRNTRREQGLLLLLPGVPRGVALARAWRADVLRHAVLGGLACVVPSFVFYLLSAPQKAPLVLASLGLAAPALLGALRNPARIGSGTWGMWGAGALLLAALPALFFPRWLVGIAVVALGLTLLLAPLRWRRLGVGAEPFPAGRYSGNSVK